jgi:hypothetical protein
VPIIGNHNSHLSRAGVYRPFYNVAVSSSSA